MRANEFIREEVAQADFTMPGTKQPVKITVPVTVNVPDTDSGDTILNVDGTEDGKLNTTIAEPATDEMPEEPIMVPPLQQQIELQKQSMGKSSPVINQIINSNNGPGTDGDEGVFANLPDGEEQPEQSIYHGVKDGKLKLSR